MLPQSSVVDAEMTYAICTLTCARNARRYIASLARYRRALTWSTQATLTCAENLHQGVYDAYQLRE